MVKITAVVLALTMLASCGQLDDTSKAETKATSATVTTTTLGTWKPSFENATTFTTTTTAITTTTSQTTTTKTTTTKKATTTVQDNSNSGNGGVVYYPSQDNNDYYYEDNQPSYNENNGDNGYSYEQPQQTEQPRQTTTTKKVEQQSKPSGNKITQVDIDEMKKELQEYANEKAIYVQKHYTEFDGYGTEYNTVDEFFLRCVRNYTPDNSSYSSVYIIPTDETDIEEVKKQLKNKIDYGYRRNEDVNFVVYIDNCPNGLDIYDGSCWAVYLLY
jgi:translation elongation factor EF-1beta